MENKVNGTCMVFHEKPVTYILSFTINRERLTVADVVDEERYQLFRELIRSIVVRAVGYNGWHTVSVMISTHKMVATRLACRIG